MTVVHTGVRDISAVTRRADVVVAAVGVPGFVKAEMIRPGAVVVSGGISWQGKKLLADVDEACGEVASWITPRLGGVGPTTVAMLLRNTIETAEQRGARATAHGYTDLTIISGRDSYPEEKEPHVANESFALITIALLTAILAAPLAAATGGRPFTVTVTEFENKAGGTAPGHRRCLGHGATTEKLNATGKFIALGEADMRNAAMAEQDGGVWADGRRRQDSRGCQARPGPSLVKGAITHVQASTTGGGGGIGVGREQIRLGGSKDKAEINATMYLVDSTTGMVMATTSVTGVAGRKVSPAVGYSGNGWGGDFGAFKNDNVGRAVEDAIAEGAAQPRAPARAGAVDRHRGDDPGRAGLREPWHARRRRRRPGVRGRHRQRDPRSRHRRGARQLGRGSGCLPPRWRRVSGEVRRSATRSGWPRACTRGTTASLP